MPRRRTAAGVHVEPVKSVTFMKTIKLPLKLFALVACLSFALSAGAYSFKYGDV